MHAHSLGWVCAHQGGALIGFVNVAGDGGVHAFVLDTVVEPTARRGGVSTRFVTSAAENATAGCEWPHVDFEEHLHSFYAGRGFNLTHAGLMALR